MKNAMEMSRKELLEVERIPFGDPIPPARSLVIIPESVNHDSGFKQMQFVLLNDKFEPIGRIYGGSDVIDIEGIGGYGLGEIMDGMGFSRRSTTPRKQNVSWCIDCLPKSRLLRLFVNDHRKEIVCGTPVSTFEVFSKKKVVKGDEE